MGGEDRERAEYKPHGDFLKLTVDLEALSSFTWLAFSDFVNFSTTLYFITVCVYTFLNAKL